MDDPTPRRTDPGTTRIRAFGHLAWWSALAMLVVNDHLLKGAGLLPNWLTGKLSDVAGLVVAVPLLVWACRARTTSTLRLVLLAVGAAFAAVELSARCAEFVESALAAVGIGWQLWPDPTDLAALAVLPLAAWLSRWIPTAPRLGRERSAALLGALACLASGGSDSGTKYPKWPTVDNESEERAMLIIASTDGVGGCDVYTQDRVSILTPDAYGVRREIVLEPGDQAPLGEGSCGAAWLQLAQDDDVYVYWRELEALDSTVTRGDQRRAKRSVVLEGRPGRWSAKLGEDLHRFDPGRVPPGSSCPEPEVTYSLRWTDLPSPEGWLELVRMQKDLDGCLEVTWLADLDDAGAEFVQTLCIPDWAFPFAEGETASATVEGTAERGVLRITHYEDGDITDQLVLWSNAEELDDAPFEGIEVEDCFGALTACGAYVRPVRVGVNGGEELLPGEEIAIEEDDADTRILIGPAVEVGWTSRGCPRGEAFVGNNVNVLALRKL